MRYVVSVSYESERAAIIEVGLRMYQKGLVTATEGNISVRVPERPARVPTPKVREPAPHRGHGGGDEDGEANQLMSVGHGRPMYRVPPWSRRAARLRISS